MSQPEKRRLPRIGMRTVKTALAASLCALIYYFLKRNPAFACIGAIFGMGSDLEDSKRSGGNRLFGTLIGGLLAMALFRVYLFFCPQRGRTLLQVPLIFIGVVLLIWLCQIFWVGGVQPGGVVLCIILFSTPVNTYVSYALNRIFDTAVGVEVALVVNSMLPGGFMFPGIRRLYRRLGIPVDREPPVEEAVTAEEPAEEMPAERVFPLERAAAEEPAEEPGAVPVEREGV